LGAEKVDFATANVTIGICYNATEAAMLENRTLVSFGDDQYLSYAAAARLSRAANRTNENEIRNTAWKLQPI
jgi:hypothetical protein